MYAFTQRLFAVPYEWGRLARIVLASAGLVGLGELLMPSAGFAGFAGRALLWAAYPALLVASGFLTAAERRSLSILGRPRELRARLGELRAAPAAASAGAIPEVYEAEAADEDTLR
jgi:hypothetical protein